MTPMAYELASDTYYGLGVVTHKPYFILNAALCSSLSFIQTLLYPHLMSSFVKMCAPVKLFVRSEMRGNGYWFLMVLALRHQ